MNDKIISGGSVDENSSQRFVDFLKPIKDCFQQVFSTQENFVDNETREKQIKFLFDICESIISSLTTSKFLEIFWGELDLLGESSPLALAIYFFQNHKILKSGLQFAGTFINKIKSSSSLDQNSENMLLKMSHELIRTAELSLTQKFQNDSTLFNNDESYFKYFIKPYNLIFQIYSALHDPLRTINSKKLLQKKDPAYISLLTDANKYLENLNLGRIANYIDGLLPLYAFLDNLTNTHTGAFREFTDLARENFLRICGEGVQSYQNSVLLYSYSIIINIMHIIAEDFKHNNNPGKWNERHTNLLLQILRTSLINFLRGEEAHKNLLARMLATIICYQDQLYLDQIVPEVSKELGQHNVHIFKNGLKSVFTGVQKLKKPKKIIDQIVENLMLVRTKFMHELMD